MAELQLQRCPACGHAPNFPRVACPHCFGPLEWGPSAGRGTVESFTVIRRTHAERYVPYVPIVMALIALDDGPRLISTIVGDDRLETEIGSPVEPATEGRWSELPQFRLA